MKRKRMGLRAQQALYNSIGRELAAKCVKVASAPVEPHPAFSPDVFATGREAYEDDLTRTPRYLDGGARPAWDELSEVAQWSWNRNPTAREHCPSCAAGAIKIKRDGAMQHLGSRGGVPVWSNCVAQVRP